MRTALISVFVCSMLVASGAFAKAPQAGKQVACAFTTKAGVQVKYLLYLPSDYAESKRQWPLVLFLHGRGESNGPLKLVTKWGPPRMAARGDKLPYILVSPQCPPEDHWSKPKQHVRLHELLDLVLQQHAVDQDRVYLTGLSMGGYGSWTLAGQRPERFAAVAPICGGGKPGDAQRLKKLPIWVFHGDQDTAVPLTKSLEMVDAIRKAGGKQLRFTTLEHVGHNSWSAAYATPGLFNWMLSKRRQKE